MEDVIALRLVRTRSRVYGGSDWSDQNTSLRLFSVGAAVIGIYKVHWV